MELMQPYLDSGRCLYADNWYTSIDLAEKLLDRQTHLVGTLRSNRKRNPKEVIAKKLVRGGVISKQNRRAFMVLKWRDRHYNTGKSYIDLTDQLGSYQSCLRKSLKWYRKIMFDIICNTSMINALSLYTGVTGNRMKLVEFREAVIQGLLRNKTTTHVPTQKINEHLLEKTSKTGRCK
ncbi:uncharacterized protein LOC111030157 [Myzus persicae]|uniref:uncharacterized protein LOC111030157 n=1 Tax=Myzus persicae TaxID=13164 RepID=UPI000B93998E|nr:uncharacterized protein LOC111030157 [Myzus persicae]